VVEGDLVLQYGVLSGTYTGEWMGIPATNAGMLQQRGVTSG
jgi:hypothetical protein